MGKKLLKKFNKILITIICAIVLIISMPIKSQAGVAGNFVNLIESIGDATMGLVNYFFAGEKWSDVDLELEGTGFLVSGRIFNFAVTPYEIFSSGAYEETDAGYVTRLGLLDVNFFADKPIISSNKTLVSSNILKPVVSNVYQALRNLALVVMLLVLLYIGIKIILSSVSSQQVKYKQMLVDWVVGLCLLFLMHYIMSFILNINTIIVEMLKNDKPNEYYVSIPDIQGEENESGLNWFEERIDDWIVGFGGSSYYENYIYDSNFKAYINENSTSPFIKKLLISTSGSGYIIHDDGKVLNIKDTYNYDALTNLPNDGKDFEVDAMLYDPDSGEATRHLAIYSCNIMEYIRTITSVGNKYVHFKDGTTMGNNPDSELDELSRIGLAIVYIALVVETIMFLIIYMKRVIQISFYTMIAPIIAFMYPIDKVGDGKSQAFDRWFKDYLFSVLLQPMHLLLYNIFIVAAAQLFESNVIYAAVIFGFMIPAEKYIKTLLGFDNASSGGGSALAGAAGGALAMNGLNKLAGMSPSGGSSGGSGSGGNEKGKVRTRKTKVGSDSSPGTPADPAVPVPPVPVPPGDSGDPLPGALPRRRSRTRAGDTTTAASRNRNPRRQSVLGKAVSRGVIRAATGGKYSTLKGQPKLAVAGAINRNLGRNIARIGGRAAGTLAMGGLGIVAGAATAIATGDVSNVLKGAGIGIAAGYKGGGAIGDGISNLAAGGRDAYRQARADIDDNYNNQVAKEQFFEENQDDLDQMENKDVAVLSGIYDSIGAQFKIKDLDDLKGVRAGVEAFDAYSNAEKGTIDPDMIAQLKEARTDAKLCKVLRGDLKAREEYKKSYLTRHEEEFSHLNDADKERLAEQMASAVEAIQEEIK